MTAVSVIVPVHNAQAHLVPTLTSIARQTLTDLQIIVVDDGSTDASAQLIADFAATDPRVQVIPGPAVGSAGAARNAGLAIADGEYLAFLDADDLFAPTFLAKLYTKAVAEQADVVVTRFRVFDEFGADPVVMDWGLRTGYLPARTPFRPDAVGDALFYAFGPVAWNKLFRTELIRSHQLRFQELPRSNDVAFTFSALALAERLSYVDRALVDYRVGNSASLQGSTDQAPLAFADALLALQKRLDEAGIGDRFAGAVATEAVEICLASLDKASSWPALVEIDAALRGGLLARLGVLDRAASGFVNPELGTRLADYLAAGPEQYVFERAARLDHQVRRARAEARAAAREVAGQPVRSTGQVPVEPPQPEPSPRLADDAAPDVSVVIPVHNAAPWLEQCLAGIRLQSGVRIEVICVDDGSSDASGLILEQAAAADPRITVISQSEAGQSVARNRGMAAATGRYVCLLDSDDFWSADALAGLVDAADRTGAELLLFDAEIIIEPGVDERTIAAYRLNYYQRSREHAELVSGAQLMAAMKQAGDYRVQPCLYLISRAFLDQHRLRFRPDLPREDNLFTFECLLRAERATHRLVSLYTRRVRPGSTVTGSSRAAAARGYYLSFVEMLRLTAGMRFDPQTSRGVGATAFKAFKQAKENFVRLEPEVGNELASLDPSPDAQAVIRILQLARDDARRARTQRPAAPKKPAPAPPPPAGPLRRLRRFAGRGRRWLRRRLQRH